jgi:hypothetical protein
MKLTEERVVEILNDDEELYKAEWNGDNAFQGMQIIAKYIDPTENDILQAAGHDIIYGPDIDELIAAGITEEDVIKLRKLNWMIEDDSYLACFV